MHRSIAAALVFLVFPALLVWEVHDQVLDWTCAHLIRDGVLDYGDRKHLVEGQVVRLYIHVLRFAYSIDDLVASQALCQFQGAL